MVFQRRLTIEVVFHLHFNLKTETHTQSTSLPATAQAKGRHRKALIDLGKLVLAGPGAILSALGKLLDLSLFLATHVPLYGGRLRRAESVHRLVRVGTDALARQVGHQECATIFLLLHVVCLVVEALSFGVDGVVFFRIVRG